MFGSSTTYITNRQDTVLLLGKGGLASELSQYFRDMGYQVITWDEYDEKSLQEYKHLIFYVAVGSPSLRSKFIGLAAEAGLKPGKAFVHSKAYVGDTNKLGDGTVIAPGSIVTANVFIDEHCLVNLDSTIGHGVYLEDNVVVCAGVHVNGNVRIGRDTFVGSNVSIREYVNIGSDVVVGMGAVVVSDLEKDGTYVGCPAKPLK